MDGDDDHLISATAFPPPYFTRGSTHQRGSILPLKFPSTKFGTRCDAPASWCARGATTTTTGPADYLSCHPFLRLQVHISHGTAQSPRVLRPWASREPDDERQVLTGSTETPMHALLSLANGKADDMISSPKKGPSTTSRKVMRPNSMRTTVAPKCLAMLTWRPTAPYLLWGVFSDKRPASNR